MRKKYIIVIYVECIKLYYNEDFNLFTTKYPTYYTNKLKAKAKAKYAKRYGTSRENANIKIEAV